MASVFRFARFLAWLVPAGLLFLLFFGVIGLVSSAMPGLTGAAVGIVAGGSLVFGVLLAYWNLVDWLNLRTIRRSLASGGTVARHGEVVAIEGVVRIDGTPMNAPFSATPCAAYAYVVAHSPQSARGERERRVLAQGFHMVRTRIEGPSSSVRLRAFPAFEDELRANASGAEWGRQARTLMHAIAGTAPAASERERESRLLDVRREVDEVHQDYCMGRIGDHADGLAIDEEVLPVGERVCVIGTYDQERLGLTARRSRLGPNLMVYRGGASEVLARVGKDVAGYTKAVAVLIGIGVLLVGVALASTRWASWMS